MSIGKLFLYLEEQTPKQERTSEELLKQNEMPLWSPVLVFSVLVSILGICITSFFLALIRIHESKATARLYDIADNFNNNNHTIKHFIKRIGIYNQEEFDYEIIKINLK